MIYAVNKQTKEHSIVPNLEVLSNADCFYVEADANGWIEWIGGECPLPSHAMVEVKLGLEITRCAETGSFWWNKNLGGAGHIIAYRPILDDEPQAPKWDGEGLPPVGTVCEVNYAEKWRECEIIAHFKQRAEMVAAFTVAYSDGHKILDSFVANCFRPIRTDRERWIDTAMEAADCKDRAPLIRTYFGAIYDAMLNNELPTPGASK